MPVPPSPWASGRSSWGDDGLPLLEVRDVEMASAVVGDVLAVDVMPGGTMVWLGATGGVARVGESAETFTAAEGPGAGPFRHVVVGPAGVIWAIGCEGLSVYAAARWNRVTLDPRVKGLGRIGAAAAGSADTVWLGAGDHLVEVDRDGHLRRGPWPSPGGDVTALSLDPDGSLWVGSASGAVARIPGVTKP